MLNINTIRDFEVIPTGPQPKHSIAQYNTRNQGLVCGGLDKARDLFLIGCYTGLRFSDYSMLKPENISVFDGVEILTVQTRKTRTRTSIPISAGARAVLDKNGGKPPVSMTNQKLNQALKEICRAAGIVESVRITSIRGGQRVETVSDKCDLVSSHTARRSWATNEYLRALREGRAWRPIMDILGMTKEATFFRYVKVSQEVTAAEFAKQRGGWYKYLTLPHKPFDCVGKFRNCPSVPPKRKA